jgi:hypothetical protein
MLTEARAPGSSPGRHGENGGQEWQPRVRKKEGAGRGRGRSYQLPLPPPDQGILLSTSVAAPAPAPSSAAAARLVGHRRQHAARRRRVLRDEPSQPHLAGLPDAGADPHVDPSAPDTEWARGGLRPGDRGAGAEDGAAHRVEQVVEAGSAVGVITSHGCALGLGGWRRDAGSNRGRRVVEWGTRMPLYCADEEAGLER